MGALVKRLQHPALALARLVGRLAVGAPRPPRATGGYGQACRGGLLLAYLIGLAVAWPLRGVGLAIMIVAVLALAQFLVLQYRGVLLRAGTLVWSAAVVGVLAAGVVVVWWRWAGRGGVAGDAVVLGSLVAALAVLPAVRHLFRLIFGPHHPESALPEPEDPAPLWFWTGGVGPDRATVVARLAEGSAADAVVVACSCDGAPGQRHGPIPVDDQRFARVELTGLTPDRHHQLALHAVRHRDDGPPLGTVTGGFATFPPAARAATLTLAFGSCLSTGSRGRVFDTIRQLEPRPHLFMVTGDLHYENITADRQAPFLAAYDQVHGSWPLRRLFATVPVAYLWDDHDFGDNDADGNSPSRAAAQGAYRRAVPSYLADSSDGPINQELTIGRVRIVMTDNRSERSLTADQLLSSETEAWLIDRITDPAWPLVIWVSPTPWISNDGDSDNWGAYPGQRQRIARAIGDRRHNLVMVSGDAHMVAIDDGSHSDYRHEDGAPGGDGAGRPGDGFPVLHAAALDRLGSAKGGPFSHSRFPGAGQFGVVTVDDRGDTISVELAGRSWSGGEIVSHSFTIDPGPAQASH